MPLSDAQKAAVAAYKAQKADRARNARLTKANPVGPRPDEWTGHDKPREVRGGASNHEATGPKVEWSSPQRGKWVQGPDKAEQFVPDESWQPRVVETTEVAPSVPQVNIPQYAPPAPKQHADGRYRDPNSTGPVGQPWVDPSKQ